MTEAPAVARCGARTRDGGVCERAPTPGKRRCRSHGGAPGSGAPKGNRNAETDGLRTREAMAERRVVAALLREGWRVVQDMEQDGTLARAARREEGLTTEGKEDTETQKLSVGASENNRANEVDVDAICSLHHGYHSRCH